MYTVSPAVMLADIWEVLAKLDADTWRATGEEGRGGGEEGRLEIPLEARRDIRGGEELNAKTLDPSHLLGELDTMGEPGILTLCCDCSG